MNIDDLQKAIDELKAEGFKGNYLIRELADRANLTFEELREELHHLPDYKRYSQQINSVIVQQRKKEEKLLLKAKEENTSEKVSATAESDYMEYLTPVWKILKDMDAQEQTIKKEAEEQLGRIQQKKHNLIATLKQFLEYAENGEKP